MITTNDQLLTALANTSSSFILNKTSLANTAAGLFFSLWRATGQPGQGGIPTVSANCNSSTVGGIEFTQQTLPNTSYGAWANIMCANSGASVEIHDRLIHMGGLNATLTTAQTVNLSLNGVVTDNMVQRIGEANFSDVAWWAEWYADTGATASNATVNVTYNDGTTGNLTAISVGGTVRTSRMIPLNQLIPATDSGKYIRAVNNVTLNASTAAAGNFGFTATRPRMILSTNVANKTEIYNWADLGLPEILNGSCLFPLQLAVTTTTGVVIGGGKIAHG